MMTNTTKPDRSWCHIRLIILIILLFALLALGIWKWFDYKIAMLQFGSDPSMMNTSIQTEPLYETF